MLLPETHLTDQPVCSVKGAQDMSPLFMDTVYDSNSPGSLSADCNSNTAGSEKEGEGPGTQYRGTKRRQKNREAARKSRKKQTERADELHEELQHLEQSNSALQKEIATLKKEANHYTTALEHHKPFCCLRASGSSLTNRLCVSPSPVDTTLPQNSSSPSKNPHQTSCSILTAAPSLSTSVTPSLGHHTHDCADNTQPSPSSGLPAELFTTSPSSSAMTATFSDVAPHSLFSEEPPSQITSRSKKAALTQLSTSLISNPVCSTVAPLPSEQDIHESSSMSVNAALHINSRALTPSSYPASSTLPSRGLDAFLMKQASFQAASSNMVPPCSYLRPPAAENPGLAAQSFPMNVPQLHQRQFRGNSKNSSIILPAPLQDPALPFLSVSQQANQIPPPASAFTLKQSSGHQVIPTPSSMLSLLTVPSPLNVPQTTSGNLARPLAQPASLVPPLGDPLSDLSLSEFLEVNDWILSGTSNL